MTVFVFFHRRDQCDLLKLLLCQAAIPCDVVTATTQREKQLDDFASGRTRVLISDEYDLEGTAESTSDFDAFFIGSKDGLARPSVD
jgi:hypothetical protein